MKLYENKMQSISVPESMYCMFGNEHVAELKMLRDPVCAGMSLEGLCYVLSSATDLWVQPLELLMDQVHSNVTELIFPYLSAGRTHLLLFGNSMFRWF